jgi:tRNA threonylcarbamoyladenosine modification (KEOPS) complex  Pcc1 subunit
MKRHAFIRLSFQSERYLKTVLNALKPETRKTPSGRSRTEIREEDGKLIVSFEAKDTSALRAAVNAYLSFASVAVDIAKMVDKISRANPSV